jgi:hypothetical protein
MPLSAPASCSRGVTMTRLAVGLRERLERAIGVI